MEAAYLALATEIFGRRIGINTWSMGPLSADYRLFRVEINRM